MKLQQLVKEMEPVEYSFRIPKMIDYLYSRLIDFDKVYVSMDWFESPESASAAMKVYILINGTEKACFTNDYENIRVEKIHYDEWIKTKKNITSKEEEQVQCEA